MRKKEAPFFFFLVAAFVSGLCESCKGGRLSLESIEPHVVYDFPDGKKAEQYLFLFVRTENCEGVKAISLFNGDSSLRWHSSSVAKIADDFYFTVFSPAPASFLTSSEYQLTLTDFYGGSIQGSFALNYDAAMPSLAETELLASERYLRRYAYFDKAGCLEIFGEIDKDSNTLKTNKDIGGKRFCCISQDGNTVCLFPYKEIH